MRCDSVDIRYWLVAAHEVLIEPGSGASDGPRAAAATARAEAIAAESAALTSFLEQNPTVLEGFARDLLPLMLEVRYTSGNGALGWSYCCWHVTGTPLVAAPTTDQSHCVMCMSRGGSDELARRPVQVYASTVQPQVRTQALLTLSKMVHYSTPDILRCVHPRFEGSFACTLSTSTNGL